MSPCERIDAAAARALGDGHGLSHVTVGPADWPALIGTRTRMDVRYGQSAAYCCVWARSRDGQRLIPYKVEG